MKENLWKKWRNNKKLTKNENAEKRKEKSEKDTLEVKLERVRYALKKIQITKIEEKNWRNTGKC